MATTAVTPTALTINTASADFDDAAGVVATTPADGWAIATSSHSGDRLLLKFSDNGGATDTITILAGDDPPAARAGLGNMTIALAASDVKYVCVEGSRFMQNDGTVVATCGAAGTKCKAFILPKGG